MKLSFVVPVYNSEKYLKRCIDSLLAYQSDQTEVVLVDDGSTDTSGQICDAYAKNNPKVRVIHTKNRGVAPTRNTGMREASGDYIFFVDNDDWIDSAKVEKVLALIDSTHVDLVINKFTMIDEHDKKILGNSRLDPHCINGKSPEEVLYYFRKNRLNTTAQWEYVIKRDVIVKNNLSYNPDQSGVEDCYFSPVLFCNCKSFYLNEDPVYFWKRRTDSQGHTHKTHDFIVKMVSAIESLNSYKNTLSEGEKYKIEYLLFSMHKNMYSLIGQYYRYSAEDRRFLDAWRRTNKKLIDDATGYSGVFHRFLRVLFGSFGGMIASYRLAVWKGLLYQSFHGIMAKSDK